KSLERTAAYLPDSVFKIADAKRGDIGNTTDMYAKAFFEHMNFDSVTIAPYMGSDSITPFLKYKDKWAIILALTSNSSSSDFQLKKLSGSDNALYQEVLSLTSSMGNINNIMYVVGATKALELKSIRELVPNHFLLIPGVGAQGGTVKDVFEGGANKECGLLINSSRGIIYASNKEDFAENAAIEAEVLQKEMESFLTV
ncbi:MAG: orotidine-5'-phosphate decarboxylase, partial [Opitutaceae bacterium]|nr:orotidine-5'-phosphate decarboxylase [Cytophagales bacterium]